MLHRSRALALKGAACAAAALAVAGCAKTSSSSSSSATITGGTLTVYVSEPLQIAGDNVAQDVVDAEKLAYSQLKGEVKDYSVKLDVVGGKQQVSYNAREAIQNATTIAYLGELDPGASDQTVGITNALDILQVSPTDTALELGQSTPAVAGAPDNYFESWSSYGRTFARLVPTSAQEAAAQVAEMKSLGVKGLFISDDGSDYGRAIAYAVRKDASGAGVTVQARLAGAGAVFYGAQSPTQAAKFFGGVSAVDPTAKLFGPSSLNNSEFTEALKTDRNLYVTIPGVMPGQLNAQGKAFDQAFDSTYGHEPSGEAIFGYAAMSALLNVLKQAGTNADSRSKVVKDFLKLSESQSVLGSYNIDSSGNTSFDSFVIARLSNGTLVPFKAAPNQG